MAQHRRRYQHTVHLFTANYMLADTFHYPSKTSLQVAIIPLSESQQSRGAFNERLTWSVSLITSKLCLFWTDTLPYSVILWTNQ